VKIPERRYILEIYEPDAADDVAIMFESTTPFGAMGVGDIVDPRLWNRHPALGVGMLRVVRVEHILWTFRGKVKHKMLIRTTSESGA
jgi:hypothetical protein